MQLLIRLPHHRHPLLLLPSVACRELISFWNTHEKGTFGLPSTEPQINICFTRGTVEIYTRLDTFGNPILCTGGLPSSRCLLNNGTASKLECISVVLGRVCVCCVVLRVLEKQWFECCEKKQQSVISVIRREMIEFGVAAGGEVPIWGGERQSSSPFTAGLGEGLCACVFACLCVCLCAFARVCLDGVIISQTAPLVSQSKSDLDPERMI